TSDSVTLILRYVPQGLEEEHPDKVRQKFGLPEDIVSDCGPQFTSRVCRELLERLNITEEAHQNLSKAIANYKRKADVKRGQTPQYVSGQQVWVSTKDGRSGPSGKLEVKYEGPYTILWWINDVTYHVGLPRHRKASQAFHVSALKLVVEGPLTEEGHPLGSPPSPIDIVGGRAYRVRVLLDSHRRGKGLQYLIDWEGFGPEKRFWILSSQVLDPDLTTSFHWEHPKKPAPRQPDQPHISRQAGSSGGFCHKRLVHS
ncbi:hypothetical protein P4O66_012436, partial [Electrophorus voltai]